MLSRLFIRDFVIVDRLELEFAAGFTALTGETGAGKSILVDALSLALGERGDAGVVRAGAASAEVSAEFRYEPDSPLAAWLAASDFAADGDSLLLRRVVDAGGRSRAYINATPAPLAQLREAAEFLADIHGQHAHHSLLRAEAQRALLDAHAGLTGLARQVAERYGVWQKLCEARANAERDAAGAAREREELLWALQELEALGVAAADWANNWQEMNQEHGRLSHAASLIEGTAAALAVLDEGGADGTPVLAQIETLVARLQALTGVDPGLAEPVELIAGAEIQLQEAVHALRRYRDRLEIEPQRLAELETRLAAVVASARKQRLSPEALPGRYAELKARAEELALVADPALLAARERAAGADYRRLAQELSAGRAATAAKLGGLVSAAMQKLAMAGGRFEIALEALPEASSHGLESVLFLVAANAGQPLRPLAKVASGGELSRIGLAIQVIASQASEVPTLIFDEVDVGIGGRVAEIVGRMLQQLGEHRQVLCVTHLPQVAARAKSQWAVSKEEGGGQSLSRVKVLSPAARVDELARMLGGVVITETTRKHAAEMLAS